MLRVREAGSSDAPSIFYFRTNVPLAPLPFLTTSSFVSNFSIVPVVDLFRTDASSALLIFKEIFFPLMTQAPRIVPVTPWPRVPLMNPVRRTWAAKLPSALNDTASASFPTWPLQFPTIAFGYSPSDTGLPSCEHEESSHASSKPNKSERTIVRIDVMIARFSNPDTAVEESAPAVVNCLKFKPAHHRTDAVGDRVHSAAGNFRPLPRPLNNT